MTIRTKRADRKENIDLYVLRGSIPIIDLAQSLGLEVRGRQARCYNSTAHKHGDNSFSLGLDTIRNRYKCFACGEQGSIIDLYKNVACVDLGQAIKELSEMAGLQDPNITNKFGGYKEYTSYNEVIESEEEKNISNAVYEEMKNFCNGLDEESIDYLRGNSRGLTDETIGKFKLFSIKDYEATNSHLKSKFTTKELETAGVISSKGNLLFYKHKIIIPFIEKGKIVFLQGRTTEDAKPKYIHLKKRVALFNTDILSKLNKGEKVYICEGAFDVISMEQNGYNAVGILGVNNFRENQAELFKGLEVVIALDNDPAGEKATRELAKIFLLKGISAKKKVLPVGINDLTDYFIKIERKK